jgi:hypothetical protein
LLQTGISSKLTLKEIKMNKLIAILAVALSTSVFAADPAANKATEVAKADAAKAAVAKKEAAKPAKSTPVKDEKAAAPAAKPASK